MILWIWLLSAATEGRPPGQAGNDDLLIMFWNLENFFDYKDGEGGASDTEFSPRGDRHWTARRFYAKCNAIAKAVLWLGGRYGRLPDAIGVAEVENAFVLRRLLQATILRKLDYGIVHRESPDGRGIDVALLYRKSLFDTLSVKLRCLYGPEGALLKTRGILCITMGWKERGDTLHLLVNHHPSKYGGSGASERRRNLAVGTLRHLADSLGGTVIAMGDFNDTPRNPVYDTLSGPLENKALPLFHSGRGSIRYDGKWELIDMFFVSPHLESTMELVEVPFLMTEDRSHAGHKPLRTYSGPRYTGGVSDHLPVVLRVQKK